MPLGRKLGDTEHSVLKGDVLSWSRRQEEKFFVC